MVNDRRRIPRVPVFFLLEHLSRTQAGSGEEGSGVVKNITPDGILLETSVPLKKNDLLQMSFSLPHSETTLNLQARVRWCELAKGFTSAGLEFMELPDEAREAIMNYLMHLGPDVQ